MAKVVPKVFDILMYILSFFLYFFIFRETVKILTFYLKNALFFCDHQNWINKLSSAFILFVKWVNFWLNFAFLGSVGSTKHSSN